MLLAIDIGNTNISCGIFAGSRIIKRFSVPTKDYGLQRIKRGLSQSRSRIDAVIICSVVPKVTRALEKDLRGLFLLQPCILGRNIFVPVKNLYRKPEQVGSDRLVNAYAGIMFYGAPLVVVDFGTAITFDVISKNREYLGGVILPGLEISLDALFQKTALLPKVKLDEPKELIGRDTKNSMLSGLIYGFAVLTDGLVERIKNKLSKSKSKSAKVIGTGGNINLIGKYCRRIDKIDKDLTLKGLSLIYNNHASPNSTL